MPKFKIEWNSYFRGHKAASIVIPLGALLALISLQIWHGKVAYQFYSYDLFVVMDGVLHLQHGHRPHIDFSLPVGVLYLVPYYIAALFAPLRGMTVVYGNALFALVAFVVAVAVSRHRLRPLWAGVFTFYVGLLAISPRFYVPEGDTLNYLNQAFYNRYAWALCCVLCLLVSLPRMDAPARDRRLFDAAICALLLFCLFYLKITYFLAGLAVVGLATVLVHQGDVLRRAGTLAAMFLGLLLAMELATGITAAYIHDLAGAAATSQVSRMRELLLIAARSSDQFLIVALLGIMTVATSGIVAGIGRKVLLLAALGGAGVAIAAYNAFSTVIPLFPVVALVAVMLLASRVDVLLSSRADMKDWSWERAGVTVGVAFLFLKPIAYDTAALVKAAVRSSASSVDLAWLQNTLVRDIAIENQPNSLRLGENKGSSCCEWNDNEYFYVLSDGVELVRRHVTTPTRILSFTWSNAFPALFGGPPIKNTLLWWSAARTVSVQRHPSGAKLLSGVDYVLIPKIDVSWSPSHMMVKVYAEPLETMFKPIGESAYWKLLARR